MDRIIALACLVGGAVLVYYGWSAAQSLQSDVSRFFTGSPTDKATWMLVGGVVLGIIGIGGLMRRPTRAAA